MQALARRLTQREAVLFEEGLSRDLPAKIARAEAPRFGETHTRFPSVDFYNLIQEKFMDRQPLIRLFSMSALLCGVALAQKTVTFTVPGSGAAANQGTFVAGVNDAGLIAGYILDTHNVNHGFVRSPSGKLDVFDAPGAGTASGEGTTVIGLNLQGTTAGYYIDANQTFHAFLRSSNGKYTTFEAPGACTGTIPTGCHGSGAWDINAFGIAVGPYEDTSGNYVAHTFIRFPNGYITTFAVPGSSMQAGQGTLPASLTGLNQYGAITGLYYDANNTFHSYLRSPNGKFVDFEAPGADLVSPYSGTFAESLNDFGTIAGYYADNHQVLHGFVRSSDGKFTTFDAPGADMTPGAFNGTFAYSNNFFGKVTGFVIDGNQVVHGFVRGDDGSITNFDVPGADQTPGIYNGTYPYSINVEGAIAGNYTDINGASHGFLRYP
jgi:predicted membrane protein